MSQALGFYNAGTQALASGSLTSAVDLLRRATRGVSEPEIKSSAWRNLGIALRRCGDEDGAIEAFTAALSIDEDLMSRLATAWGTCWSRSPGTMRPSRHFRPSDS